MNRARHVGRPSADAIDRPVGESGASLLFVLAFIALTFSVMVALFGYTQVGIRGVDTYRRDKTLRYAGDGALEAAVQMVKDNPDMGAQTATFGSSVPACALRVDVDELTGPRTVMTAGSYVVVTCEPTYNQPSGGLDTDGGQRGRDVTFTVTCATSATRPPPDDPLPCGVGPDTSQVVELAKARVRFEPDYGHDPATGRAIVPKVISWRIYGGDT